MTTATLHPYYDLGPVVSANCWFNVVVGERGVGKTFGFIKRAIKRAIKFGEEFIYLRRYATEMAPAKANFFTEFSMHFPDYEFRVDGQKGQFRPIVKDDEGDDKSKKVKWKTICHFFTLASAITIKSVNLYNVRQCIFDEFILEKGLYHYLPNEAKAFYGFVKSVDRDRDRVRWYLLGNSASSTNPYFIEWGIRPSEMEEYTQRGDTLFIHIARSLSFRESIKSTALARLTAGTEFDRYANQNEFLDEHNALVGSKPSRATPQWNLETIYGTFSAWVDPNDGTYYMQERLIAWDTPTLTMLPERMDENKILVSRESRILQRVRTAYRRGGSVYYDTPRTRNAMLEVFKR